MERLPTAAFAVLSRLSFALASHLKTSSLGVEFMGALAGLRQDAGWFGTINDSEMLGVYII